MAIHLPIGPFKTAPSGPVGLPYAWSIVIGNQDSVDQPI